LMIISTMDYKGIIMSEICKVNLISFK